MQKVSIYDQMTNAEKEVAELLKKMGIKWSYEQPVFVWDENNRPRTIASNSASESDVTPFLFDLIPGLYITVFL